MADLEPDEQPTPLGILGGAVNERPVRDGDDLGGVVEVAGRCLDCLPGGLRGLLHDRGDDRFLAVEVVVEGPEADVGLVGDLVDPSGVDPLTREASPAPLRSAGRASARLRRARRSICDAADDGLVIVDKLISFAYVGDVETAEEHH